MIRIARPRAVIFDMDGLLLDSERVSLELFAQAATSLQIPWTHEVGLSMVGLNSRDSNQLLTAAFGADYPVESLRERFGELYEAAIVAGLIPLKPHVTSLLDQLERLGIPRAVATSTRRTRAEAKLLRAGIRERFMALACGDEVVRGKPHPDIFELAARHLGVEGRDCLVLEDSNAGVRGAVAASMQVVMVPDLLKPDPDIRRLGVPVVESLREVIAALG
ncbi:MAG: HAD family phosphatase [Moraxellaceae bacterium]|nr:HAD family phosphatase [Moraxellaceae bacterium]